MRKYFYFELKQIWFSLLIYLILETFIGCIKFVALIFRKNSYVFSFLVPMDAPLGLYMILQGLILIYQKKTRDPIERISKIGYL